MLLTQARRAMPSMPQQQGRSALRRRAAALPARDCNFEASTSSSEEGTLRRASSVQARACDSLGRRAALLATVSGLAASLVPQGAPGFCDVAPKRVVFMSRGSLVWFAFDASACMMCAGAAAAALVEVLDDVPGFGEKAAAPGVLVLVHYVVRGAARGRHCTPPVRSVDACTHLVCPPKRAHAIG